jgi:histidinol-phosphate aminotransferase
MNRRYWLKSTAALATGLAAGPMLLSAKTGSAVQALRHPWRIYERNLQFPPDMDNLRARLLANENPYGPSDGTRLAIMDAVGLGNRYGHGDAMKLISMLAEKEGVTPDHILLGPGSTDLLEKTAIILLKDGGNVVTADPAYMSIVNTARSFGAKWKAVPLTRDYAHDLAGMKQAIDSKTRLVYVCNPNNPTGTLTPADDLKKFCAEVSEKVPVFVDEAYLEFLDDPAGSTTVGLIREGKDLIVSRTFSKIHGMAGLRMGYIVGQPERLAVMRDMVRTTMGLCITTLRGAMASLEDTAFHERTRKLTADARQYVYDVLEEMGISYIPSHTSFLMFPLQMDGDQYLEAMFAQGVGVRLFMVDGKPWSRVSMGTLPEMEIFAQALKQVIG